MSKSLKWMHKICFGLFAVLASASAFAGSARSSIPVRQLLEGLQSLENQLEQERLAAAEEVPLGAAAGFVEWEADLLPDSIRSFLYYDLSDESLDALEQNKDEKGATLL